MSPVDLIGTVAIGFAAGVTSGLLGVGGGILFVPGLVIFLDQSQLEAESTSLVAIVIVSIVGTWRQHGYGNVRPRDALVIGVLSPLGVLAGAALANGVSERVLELSFAGVQLYFAWTILREQGVFTRRSTR